MNTKIENTIICLPIEILKRDLEVKIFLGLKFLKYYKKVIVGAQHELLKYIKDNKKDNNFIYLEKGLNNNDDDPTYNFLLNNNCRIASLSEEGGIFDELWFTIFDSYASDKSIKYIDLLLNWGPMVHNRLLKERKKINNQNSFISGHPRFDLCKKEFNNFNKFKLKKYYKSKKKYILVISTFYDCNPMINNFVEDIFNKYIIWDAAGYKEFKNFQSNYALPYRKLVMNYFVDATLEIASKYKNINVIYRPHPSENSKTYEKLFKKIDNIIITNDGLVNEWINSSEAVIHHDCTSALQTYFNGKTPISYCPVIDQNITQIMTIKISKIIKNKKELINLIGEAIKDPNKLKQKNDKDIDVRNFIDNLDYSSADLITNLIYEKISLKNKGNKNIINNNLKFSNKFFFKKTIKEKIIKLLFYPFVKKRENIKYFKINFKFIKEIISFMNSNNIKIDKLKYSKLGKYSFIIFK